MNITKSQKEILRKTLEEQKRKYLDILEEDDLNEYIRQEKLFPILVLLEKLED